MPKLGYYLPRPALIGVLCLLVFILSLQTRLLAFEPQKVSVKTFVDSELWRKGQSTELSALSNSPALHTTSVPSVPLFPDSSAMRCVAEKPAKASDESARVVRLQRPPPGRWSDDAFWGFLRNLRRT
jgi:hypothetical protein